MLCLGPVLHWDVSESSGSCFQPTSSIVHHHMHFGLAEDSHGHAPPGLHSAGNGEGDKERVMEVEIGRFKCTSDKYIMEFGAFYHSLPRCSEHGCPHSRAIMP